MELHPYRTNDSRPAEGSGRSAGADTRKSHVGLAFLLLTAGLFAWTFVDAAGLRAERYQALGGAGPS